MPTSSSDIQARRNPWIALVLSLAATGLGHIYCGQLAKGLILFFAGFAFAPIIVLSMQEMSSLIGLVAAAASILLLVAVFLYALIDAYRTARRSAIPYRPREYNRWYIYLLFIVVSLTYPTTLSQSIRAHLLQAFKIPSHSMAPNILKGDYLLLNKAIYKQHAPQRGDVVIFINPNRRHQHYIKRIVALPGDTIAIKANRIWINGQPLAYEEHLKTAFPSGSGRDEGVIVTEIYGERSYRVRVDPDSPQGADFTRLKVPNGLCFVLGDNRSDSVDSRQFGPIPLADVLGRVDFIYWPAGSWARFGGFESGKG